MTSPTFRAFLFAAQNERCYLGTTDKCRIRDRKMRFDGKRKNDFASTEHVIPRCKKVKGDQSLILLACCNCNNAKGDADPEPEHVELAMKLRAAYRVAWWTRLTPRA